VCLAGAAAIVTKDGPLVVGRVTSIESNHKEVDRASRGSSVAVKIVNEQQPTMTYGRQFDHTNQIMSKLSRESIDALKQFFRNDLSTEDWKLVKNLKPYFNIP
jgi:translation initiation factor 5B